MTNLELAAAIAAASRLSLDEARALGFSIDYPAHPLGRGGFLRGEGWTVPILARVGIKVVPEIKGISATQVIVDDLSDIFSTPWPFPLTGHDTRTELERLSEDTQRGSTREPGTRTAKGAP